MHEISLFYANSTFDFSFTLILRICHQNKLSATQTQIKFQGKIFRETFSRVKVRLVITLSLTFIYQQHFDLETYCLS